MVKITAPNQSPQIIRKTARMTWMPAEDRIPPESSNSTIQLGIAFTHYSVHSRSGGGAMTLLRSALLATALVAPVSWFC